MIWLEVVRVLRRLRTSWRFSCAVIASVGIAVGPILVATSICDAVFLRDLAVTQSSRQLVAIRSVIGSRGTPRGLSFPDYQDLRAALPSKSWQQMTAWATVNVTRATIRGDQPLRLAAVSGDYFRLSSARFVQGHAPREQEIEVVVTRALWRRLSAEGDTAYLAIYGHRYPVTAVIDDSFHGLYPAEGIEAWIPLSALPLLEGDSKLLSFRELENLSILVATAADTGAQLLQPSIAVVSAHLAALHEGDRGWHLQATSATSTFLELLGTPRGQSAFASFLVLLCILLIAATNIANLFVVRAAAREVESQVRLALGLPRAHLILYECVEPLVLSLIGLAFGLWWGTLALHYLRQVPVLEQLGLRSSIAAVLAACIAALIFAVICAIMPAIGVGRAREADIVHVGQGITSRRVTRLQRVYLVVQFTLALGFTYVAVLLALAVRQQGAVNVGFDTKNLFVIRGAQSADGRLPAQWRNDYDRSVAAVSSLPDVISVSGSLAEFFGGWGAPGREIYTAPGDPHSTNQAFDATMEVVGPHYFATLGLPVLAGREFGEEEKFGAPKNIIVNESLAKLVASGGQALGLTVYEHGNAARQIIGIVPDIRATAAEKAQPSYYRSLSETPLPTFVLYIRVTAPSPTVASAIVAAMVREMPQSAGRFEIHTVQERRAQRDLPALTMFGLSVGLAALTILIAGLGLYSVASFGMAIRRREHGIRSALGASPGQLAALVLGEGIVWTAAATGLSLPFIWVGVKVVRTLVLGARPVPLFATVAVIGAYLVIIVISLAFPARRVASLNPAEAIRSL
jgi:putative ABC transport system permease protein